MMTSKTVMLLAIGFAVLVLLEEAALATIL